MERRLTASGLRERLRFVRAASVRRRELRGSGVGGARWDVQALARTELKVSSDQHGLDQLETCGLGPGLAQPDLIASPNLSSLS
ncbi:uncharacterized protein A4U43_C03F1120 [Asparagus officinalis]|uniref:Uncharacterized protein n=1 Tax=Asparagus officinalis TaxID=4686 RepID=A0A5P1F963_ASPOF|nr:uncharacterized protein A4U43_C03F1120 [Asparagus officinalis]